MASFKTPRRGGNVVHRLEFQALTGRRTQRRRLIGSSEPAARPSSTVAPARDVESLREVEVRVERNGDAASSEGSTRQIGLLERRLEKMSRLLDDRDREILSLAERRADDDGGVASIYRSVQGVQGRGKEAKQRKEFMSRIFEANLKLQERVRPASSGAE